MSWQSPRRVEEEASKHAPTTKIDAPRRGYVGLARLARVAWLVGGIVGCTAGCTAAPPPLWAEGGAPLTFASAAWTHLDGSQLRLDERGQVTQDGEYVMALDRAGRVVDPSNDPIALLDADGQLFGTDNAYLGRVGLHNAAPPWSPEAWLRVTNKGTVVLFDVDGEATGGGRWAGCDGPVLRTCTLLTHLLLLQSVQQASNRASYYAPSPSWYGPYPSWGLGFGFYY